MKRLLLLLFSAQLVVACASDIPDLAHENQSNLVKLSVGMSKPAVVELMGAKSAYTPDGTVSNPFSVETFQDKAGVNYEVLYYVTERNRRFQPLRLRQTTPLVFRNGVLTGWGTESLKRARDQGR